MIEEKEKRLASKDMDWVGRKRNVCSNRRLWIWLKRKPGKENQYIFLVFNDKNII